MSLGGTTITFVTVTEDLTDVDRYNNAASVRTTTNVPGCHFRPLRTAEKLDLGDVVSDLWKATCPPVPAVLAAQAKDEIQVDGITYRLDGSVQVFDDLAGVPFKCTAIAKRVSA